MFKFAPLAVFFALVMSACSTPQTRPPDLSNTDDTDVLPAPAAAVAAPAANDNLNAVAWTQAALEHDLIYRQTYRAAIDQLDRALADLAWEALPEGERKTALEHPQRAAVILDIDETVLDNSPYQARLIRNGSNYNEVTWAAWCREESARALPGSLEFARYAASQGVTVFYLSNRALDLGDATLANLRKAGFPIASNDEVFLGLGTVVSGCEQNGSEKGCRRELISRTHRVLLQVGDQLGDFVDVMANTPDGRQQAVAPYLGWIGERWFVLPNPTYGSWESALLNNDWSRPEGERRQAKQEQLRVH